MGVEHGEATGQSSCRSAGRPGIANGADRVSNRVITEHAASRGLGSHVRAARAVDVIRSTFIEHAAGDVVYLNIRVSRRLDSPGVSARIVLERMSKFGAGIVRIAPAHRVKLPISREKHASKTGSDTWKIRTGRPTAARGSCCGRRTWRRRWSCSQVKRANP